MSLKKKLLGEIKQAYPKIIHSGKIERIAMNLGYKASNSGRRCRELVVENKIKPYYRNGQVSYQYIEKSPVCDKINDLKPSNATSTFQEQLFDTRHLYKS